MNKEKLGKVGGQAVIEGVMMQSQDYKAVAVRKSNGGQPTAVRIRSVTGIH